MKAKRPPSSRPALSRARVVSGALVITATLWWLNWVRAGAAPSEPAASAGMAAQESARPLRGMDELVSLDLRSTEATDALKYLATKGGLNVAISKNVSGRVNLFLADVPIRDVFDLILLSNELAYDKKGDVYNIMTEDEYRKLYGRKFADLRQVRTFRLQYAIPQQAFNLLDTLKSEVGRILVDEDSGTVMVIDTPEQLAAMERAMATLEQGGLVRVVDLKYAKAKDIEERLKDQIEVNKLGYVRADERSNQLLVKAFPERLRELEQLIAALDRKTREVLIDAKIVKVTMTDDRDTGINWDTVFANIKFHGLDRAGTFRTSSSGTAPSETPAVSRLDLDSVLSGVFSKSGDGGEKQTRLGDLVFGTVNTSGYELFRYLETIGRTKLVSNPRLMVTENQEAKIHVGTREAYVTTTTTTGQSTSTTAEDVEFIDVGIQLSVTPQINADGFVTMKVKPEVSSVVRTLTTPGESEIPIVDTSTAQTTVMVADGATVIIGGLRKNEKKRTNEQLPYLHHIPLIGPALFRQVDQDDETSELVVFLTPHIMQGDRIVTGDEGGKITGFREYAPILSSKEGGG